MTQYEKSFLDSLSKITELAIRKGELDEQIAKLTTLAEATYELMDEKEKALHDKALQGIIRTEQSLTEAVRRALGKAGREYLTPVQIRDQLVRSGYDFSRYESNPLVSVHSTLNRIKDELEVATLEDGTKGYRFRRNAARSKTLR
jgi:hypothetical protein